MRWLARFLGLLRTDGPRPLVGERFLILSRPTRTSIEILRAAERCGQYGLPFVWRDQSWLVSRIDVEDGIAFVEGIPFPDYSGADAPLPIMSA
jgi:hypothetical protein